MLVPSYSRRSSRVNKNEQALLSSGMVFNVSLADQPWRKAALTFHRSVVSFSVSSLSNVFPALLIHTDTLRVYTILPINRYLECII